ncbi:MAG: hypothetical protein LH647_00110, partial [Leptolyngbyaceae cyanobacterium CAN_BIN12]|nr:hypothetical protein [Leptolyngbyaceae cyanobacterium CAN_BIN12]
MSSSSLLHSPYHSIAYLFLMVTVRVVCVERSRNAHYTLTGLRSPFAIHHSPLAIHHSSFI